MADTLVHELVAFQSNALIGLKKAVKKVEDPQLKALYVKRL